MKFMTSRKLISLDFLCVYFMIVSNFGDSHIKNQYQRLLYAHDQNKEKDITVTVSSFSYE